MSHEQSPWVGNTTTGEARSWDKIIMFARGQERAGLLVVCEIDTSGFTVCSTVTPLDRAKGDYSVPPMCSVGLRQRLLWGPSIDVEEMFLWTWYGNMPASRNWAKFLSRFRLQIHGELFGSDFFFRRIPKKKTQQKSSRIRYNKYILNLNVYFTHNAYTTCALTPRRDIS